MFFKLKKCENQIMVLMGFLFLSLSVPAYAEVETVQTDRLFYSLGDKITFSGTVDDESTGLVTIVIRDSNDKFVLLTQAIIEPDNTFERSVDTNEKFSTHGIYNATAFLVNMTEGSLARFDYSLDGSPVNPVVNLQDSNNDKATIVSSQTTVQEISEPEPEPISKIASFVDPTKDPQYYIDRYNNELAYKEWFDANFPNITIYDAVGVNPVDSTQNVINSSINEPAISTQELPTTLVESSTVNPNFDAANSEIGQMLLALGGLGVLFGAVYGVKRKVDSNTEQIVQNKSILQKKVEHNSEQISQNRFWLKKKLMRLKPNDEPVSVIKERLAKGEITVDEYYKLLRALKK